MLKSSFNGGVWGRLSVFAAIIKGEDLLNSGDGNLVSAKSLSLIGVTYVSPETIKGEKRKRWVQTII